MGAFKKVLLVVGACIVVCVVGWTLLIGAVFAWGGVMTVQWDNPHGPNVSIPVPMAVVDAAVTTAVTTSDLVLEDLHVDLGEWGPMVSEMLDVIEDCPDAVFVEVQDRGDHVRVAKEGGYLKVEVRESGRDGIGFKISLPTRVATRTISRLVG